jgi:hypothetical protein
MKKLVVLTVASGLFLSAMTLVAQNGKAMQDAKDAQKYGGAKFDGSKVKKSDPTPIGGGQKKPDYKALNKGEQQRQAQVSKKAHLDKPNSVPPPQPPKKK